MILEDIFIGFYMILFMLGFLHIIFVGTVITRYTLCSFFHNKWKKKSDTFKICCKCQREFTKEYGKWYGINDYIHA